MSLETRGARGLGFGVSNRNRVARASDFPLPAFRFLRFRLSAFGFRLSGLV